MFFRLPFTFIYVQVYNKYFVYNLLANVSLANKNFDLCCIIDTTLNSLETFEVFFWAIINLVYSFGTYVLMVCYNDID